MATVKEVDRNSPFYGLVLPGDELVSVNGNTVRDVLDYMYETASDSVEIAVKRNGGVVSFRKDIDGPVGIVFDDYLMSPQRSCRNKCMFCFIDQLPKGMRDTLYYKDDDFRLSVLYGNYVTLTNTTDEDIDRIIRIHAPMNISVHTTESDLRVRMMKNPRASDIMDILNRFRDNGIQMRCQVVLCKGVNDGAHLERTLNDLKSLYPCVSSISVVPFGATMYRDGLENIELFSAEECSDIIDFVSGFGSRCLEELGTRLVYEADEFYVKSGRKCPSASYYEDFEQIENGVGMISSFDEEFRDAVKHIPFTHNKMKISSVSGVAMKNVLPDLIPLFRKKMPGLRFDVHFIENRFFGESVTVTGLVTGSDILAQLSGKDLGDVLLVPETMLRDGLFLDDVSVGEISEKLGVAVKQIPCDAFQMVDFVAKTVRGGK